MDVKPANFFIDLNGIIKIGDFNLCKKKLIYDEDNFEGDCLYMAPEILLARRIKDLDEKVDIFSTGVSFMELLFKMDLPQGGEKWSELRSQRYIIPKEGFNFSNVRNVPEDFCNLIYGMIHEIPKKRFSIQYIFENFPEIGRRWNSFLSGKYQSSFEDFVKNQLNNLIIQN